MKVVINRCYGGFGLSHEAAVRVVELGYVVGQTLIEMNEEWRIERVIPRHNPFLVQHGGKKA